MAQLTVFLGGSVADNNAWREDVKKMKLDNLVLVDPYKEDWDPNTDIYSELKQMLSSDYVVFYKGWKGSVEEIEILKIVKRPKFKRFDRIDELKSFLQVLNKSVESYKRIK